MTITFRPITTEDLDHLFSLRDAGKLDPYLLKFLGYRLFFEQGKQIAVEEEIGCYLLRLPSRGRDFSDVHYVLVSNGGIILSDGGATGPNFPVEYISPELLPRLDELTPFLREAFSKGGEFLFGKPRPEEQEVFAEKRFTFPAPQGE